MTEAKFGGAICETCMALTYSPKGGLGSWLPQLILKSVEGKEYALTAFKGAEAVVVMFICNHCPYVRAIEGRLIALSREFTPQGVQFVGICSNDPADHPEDQPEALLERWRSENYGFPYLVDESQSAARALGAVCTPDLYIYDRELKLRYRGRLDDSWRNPAHVQRQELKEALVSLLNGDPIPEPQNPSMGCSIKWKKG